MSDWKCSLQEALSRRWRKEFPEFFEIAKGLISATMKTLEGGDSGSFTGEPDRHKIVTPLGQSNIIGSEITTHCHQKRRYAHDSILGEQVSVETEPLHKPVLDIDLPCWLRESSTPGHYHLIIDKEMTWSDYKRLLNVMADVGVLEPGFVKAALSRGASWIRTPWTPKLNGDKVNE